jgi:methylenetetrahydrofolate dehydrogenase (NADP+)/methenyltetrahydrofolate cyclohydrolase
MVLFKANNYIDELDLVIKNKFEKLETEKKLVFVNIGNNKANKKYVEVKTKMADHYGIETEVVSFKTSVKKKEVLETLTKLSEDTNCGGIVVQYPFPQKFSYKEISQVIVSSKDVDFFNPKTYGEYVLQYDEEIMPPTVKAFDFLCNTFKLEFKGKNFLVVGQGKLVGRPITNYLLNNEATVVSINEFTENKEDLIKEADMVVCASGQPNSIKGSMLKRGACVVDFSFGNKENPGVGDFDIKSETSHLNIVSGVPGGMGPLTVRFLFLTFLDMVEKEFY